MQPLGLSSILAVVSSLMAGSVLISGPSPLQRVYYGDEWSSEVLVHFHAAHEPKHEGREGLSKEHGQAWLAKEISSLSPTSRLSSAPSQALFQAAHIGTSISPHV